MRIYKLKTKPLDKTERNTLYETAVSILYQEYSYEFDKTSKIDNKINIALTFCGVVIVYLCSVLDLSLLCFTTLLQVILSVCVIQLWAIAFLFLAYVLRTLFKIMRPCKYDKLVCAKLNEWASSKTINDFDKTLCNWLQKSIDNNRKTNSDRVYLLSKAFGKLPLALASSIIANILTQIILLIGG